MKQTLDEASNDGVERQYPPPASAEERSPDSSRRITLGSASEPASSEPDLTALALAARTHEPQAMRAFLETIAPTVRGVCRGVLGAGHVEFDDTTQECLMEILRALAQYRAEGPVLHYAKQIALRCAIAARKRSRSREQRLRAFAQETSIRSFEAEALPSLRVVRDVIDELPAVQAEALLMRTILGFSLEEIALATQVSVNTAKSRLRVAKENLRYRLERELSTRGNA